MRVLSRWIVIPAAIVFSAWQAAPAQRSGTLRRDGASPAGNDPAIGIMDGITSPASALPVRVSEPAAADGPVTTAVQVRRAEQASENLQQTIDAAVARVKPSLVRIQVVEASYYEGRANKFESSGSGAIIAPEGYIVTNHHVAGNALKLVVTMPNREEVPAELIGTDAMSDIAIIKLKPTTTTEYPYVEWGDSAALEVGDTVLAMGSPLALSQSVTEGIVSNTEMTMPIWAGGFELDGEDVGSIVRWIAHDAAIFGGNSGGPLVNLQGEIVGINEISYGLGGAIPSDLARGVAEQLIAHGKIDRAFLGFLLQPNFKFEQGARGAIISDVIAGSPAEKAGIQAGDRLLAIEPAAAAAREINIQFHEELPPLNLWMSALPIGNPVTVRLQRNGQEIAKTVTPVVREPVLPGEREFNQWGLTGRDLSIWTAIEMKREGKEGVLVTSVRTGGPAGQAKPELRENDIIVQANGEPIADMDALTSLTARVTRDAEEPVPVLVHYERGDEQLMTVVKVGLDELDDPGREVRKAWVPVGVQALTRDLAEQLGLAGQSGVRVTQLYDDGGTSGGLPLQIGDLIIAIDDEPVRVSEPQETDVFWQRLRQYRIGTPATFTLLRSGRQEKVTVELSARPPQPREMKRYQDFDFEFTARNLAYLDRVNRQLEEEVTGVLIESVEDGGWAALGRLSAGDILLEVDGRPVHDVETLRRTMEQIKQRHADHVIFKIRRGVHTLFIELEPAWK